MNTFIHQMIDLNKYFTYIHICFIYVFIILNRKA